MKLESIIDDMPWLTEEESKTARVFLTAMAHFFEQHGVVVTPFVVLRTEGLLADTVVARRIESVFRERPNLLAPGKDGAPECASNVIPAVETAGKLRERSRKTMKELEETCEKAGTSIDKGLAGKMLPVLKRAEGVLEDALGFEEKKQRRTGRKGKQKPGNAVECD